MKVEGKEEQDVQANYAGKRRRKKQGDLTKQNAMHKGCGSLSSSSLSTSSFFLCFFFFTGNLPPHPPTSHPHSSLPPILPSLPPSLPPSPPPSPQHILNLLLLGLAQGGKDDVEFHLEVAFLVGCFLQGHPFPSEDLDGSGRDVRFAHLQERREGREGGKEG